MLNMFTTKYVDKIMISANIKYIYVKHITFITKITFLWGNYVYSPQFCYISYNHIELLQTKLSKNNMIASTMLNYIC